MRRLAITTLCFLLPWTAAAQTQSSEQALKDFRDQVLKQPLIPRGFSDDLVTTFQWNGTDLSFTEPKFHTLGVIKAESIKLKDSKLKITAKRQTLVRDKDGTLKLAGGSPATIIVDLPAADPALTLQALRSQLFFSSPQDAFAELPPEYAAIVKNNPKPREAKDSTPPATNKDCPVEGQKVKLPSLLYAPDAEFSEEARQARYSGSVEVALTVGLDGLPNNLWLIRPAGLGLDAKALDAASKYKFHPATCDGKPLRIKLFIDVDFKIM